MSKLRRQRDYPDEAPIRSGRPSPEAPASRAVAPPPPDADGAAAGGEDPLAGVVALDQLAPRLALADARDLVIQGDSLEALRRLPDGCVACAITSPPYWNLVDYGFPGQIGPGTYAEYRAALSAVWREVARVLQPNGKLCLNVPLMPLTKEVSRRAFGPTHTRYLVDLYGDLKADVLAGTDLLLYSLYLWEKQTTEKMFGSYPYPPNLYERNVVEFIGVFVKPGKPPRRPPAVKEAARLTSAEWMDLTKQVWWIYPENVRRREGHPAPFPEALPNRLISLYTFPQVEAAEFPGDLVLDPFAGWGTTCVAAKRLGRRWLGIDGQPAFCREAAQRLASTPREPRVLLAERPSTS